MKNRDGKLENNGLNLEEKFPLDQLPKNIIVDAMKGAITDKSFTTVASLLSQTTKRFQGLFKADLGEQAVKKLCQAIIDDDRKMVKRILDSRPDVLLVDPPKDFMIESQLTWQRLIAEKPAVMAAKRNQLKMLELILPYYDELLVAAKDEQEKAVIKNAKAEVIASWREHPTQENVQGEKEIIVPAEYSAYIKSLIDIFAQETFPNGTDGADPYGHGKLSVNTEKTLEELFNKLLPEKAVKLDYLDVELLLLAAYKTYVDQCNTFQNWNQRDAFAIRVVGLILTALPPEKAKIYCEGLDEVVEALKAGKEIKISDLALSHKLKSGDSFYRSRRDSKEGQGFSFFTGIFAGQCIVRTASYHVLAAPALDLLSRVTTANFENFLHNNNHINSNKKRKR